jgi:hypothetical protein
MYRAAEGKPNGSVSNRVQGTWVPCPSGAGGILFSPAGCLLCRWDGQRFDVEWCPSLRCGYASGYVQEDQRLDVEWRPSLRCWFTSGSVQEEQRLYVEWRPSLRCGFASGSVQERQRLDAEWRPSLRCGFASGSVQEEQSLDVWSRLSMIHVKQRPCDASDTLPQPRKATRVSITSDCSSSPRYFPPDNSIRLYGWHPNNLAAHFPTAQVTCCTTAGLLLAMNENEYRQRWRFSLNYYPRISQDENVIN